MVNIQVPDEVAATLLARANAKNCSVQDIICEMLSRERPVGPAPAELGPEWVEIRLIPKIRAYRGPYGFELHWRPEGWPSSPKPWAVFGPTMPLYGRFGALATFEAVGGAIAALEGWDLFKAAKAVSEAPR
jgi:hypothetical protein